MDLPVLETSCKQAYRAQAFGPGPAHYCVAAGIPSLLLHAVMLRFTDTTQVSLQRALPVGRPHSSLRPWIPVGAGRRLHVPEQW